MPLNYPAMLGIHPTFCLLLVAFPTTIPAQRAIQPTTTSNKSDGRVLNAPYSAQRRFTSVDKRPDGTSRSSESGGSEARDSQGRTYSAGERHWTYLDHGKPVLKSETLYRIDDPVSNTETRWDSTSKEVKIIHWPKVGNRGTIDIGAFLPPFPDELTEKLGVRTIEGVIAEGARSSYTIAGAQGQNGRAVSVVHEIWYCPELRIVVLETNDDPRSGTTRNELVGIARSEPDVTKYRPPAGYVVHDIRLPLQ